MEFLEYMILNNHSNEFIFISIYFLLLNAAIIRRNVSSEMPEYPLARILIRNANIIRARSIVNGSPTPAQCETINRDCRSLYIQNNIRNRKDQNLRKFLIGNNC